MEKNNGITVLKIVMSFAVVCRHFWKTCRFEGLYSNIYPITLWAVPTFMIISFMLSYKHFQECDCKWIKSRIWKLYKPILYWGVIFYLIYKMLGILVGESWVTGKDLLIQLCTGASPSICPSMWFEFDLIVLSIIAFLLIYWFGVKGGEALLCILGVTALISEYTGWISLFFADKSYAVQGSLGWSVQHSFGMLPEMFPFVVIGYLFSKFDIIHFLKKYGKISGWFLTISLIIIVVCQNKFPVAQGIWYSGIYLILVTTIVVVLFCLVPEAFWNNGRSVINFLGKYTMGVYFMHSFVGFLVNIVANKMGFEVSTLGVCFVIYFLSIIISALIDRLPFRFCKGLV